MKILTQKNPNIKINYIYVIRRKINKIKFYKILEIISLVYYWFYCRSYIDIPNSTIMLVLDANRFGASSLHQIRGRVGRSDLQGYCYLIAKNLLQATRRLKSLEDSNNGLI